MEKIWVGIFGLLGVIVGGGIAIGKELWMDRKNRERNAIFLATRVVCILNDFVESCATVVLDDGYYNRPPNGEPELVIKEPKLDFESLDVDWSSIPKNLMYEILNFPNKIKNMKASLHDYADHADCYAFISERQLRYAEMGLKARMLIGEFHRRYGVPKEQYENSWNPIKVIKEFKLNA